MAVPVGALLLQSTTAWVIALAGAAVAAAALIFLLAPSPALTESA